MRLFEFANAKEQLGLLRIIIDNTWAAIAQQAAEQQRAEAEREAQKKLRPSDKKRGKGGKVHIPSPPQPLPKQTNANGKPTVPSPANQPTQANPNAVAQHPSAYPKPNPPPQSAKVEPEAIATPDSKAAPDTIKTYPSELKAGKSIKNQQPTDYSSANKEGQRK